MWKLKQMLGPVFLGFVPWEKRVNGFVYCRRVSIMCYLCVSHIVYVFMRLLMISKYLAVLSRQSLRQYLARTSPLRIWLWAYSRHYPWKTCLFYLMLLSNLTLHRYTGTDWYVCRLRRVFFFIDNSNAHYFWSTSLECLSVLDSVSNRTILCFFFFLSIIFRYNFMVHTLRNSALKRQRAHCRCCVLSTSFRSRN